jgi:uncharacterized protein (AIM24 family)
MPENVRAICKWCKSPNDVATGTCTSCGAPLEGAELVSDSGWREAPRLKDLTEIRFGLGSMIQVEGEIVPVADVTLAQGDAVFFEHHALLWKDEQVPLAVAPVGGSAVGRMLGGMPIILSMAAGPGRIAFSRDGTGELIVMPMAPGTELDVRGHAFLLASHTLSYQYEKIKGLRNIIKGGEMYMDEFHAGQWPGVLVLHGYGNVFERTLAAGESILLEPGAFLYKDGSVTMNVEQQDLKTGIFGRHNLWLSRMTGPGRVGIQSMFHHHGE